MLRNFNIMETRKMSKAELDVELGKYTQYIMEKCGMNKVDASSFVSTIMCIGIAVQEKWNAGER